ncbi:MAG: hypothetical protein AAF293_10510 [Pseudomonadota bacterium]
MRRDVVTIYFCGSGNDRTMGDTNALPHLFNNTVGKPGDPNETGRAVIFDGPGGAKILNTEKIMKMVDSGKDSSKGILKSKSSAWKKMLKNKHNDHLNAATGGGTQSNIVTALQWLWLAWHEERFVDINVAGFSRGGVSCIMLAHAIQEAGFSKLGNVRVNLFTFDPVPGSMNDFKNSGTFGSTGRAGKPTTLPPCVHSYRSILQENIAKLGWVVVPKDRTFKCVVPDYTGSNPKRTPRELFPMPGGHSASQAYSRGPGTGEIGIHLCQEFLEAHGTTLTCNYKLSPIELIEAYSSVRFFYTKKVGTFGDKKKASKHRKDLITNPFRSHEFFINSHHATLVYANAPEIAQCIDKGTPLQDSLVGKIKSTMPRTHMMLEGMGYLN